MAGARSLLAASMSRRRLMTLLAAGPASALPAVGGARARRILPTPLARGFNLPGWVDREQGVAPARSVLKKLRSLGFASIRLPVAADPLLAGGDTARAMLRRIADAVALCETMGFAVVLDLHPGGNFAASLRDDPAEGSRQAVAAWRLLRDVVAEFSSGTVFAELLNEPPMEQADWLTLRDELAGVIRQTCPRHGIVWGPARYQGMWELAGTTPVADERAIVAIHYYSPMAFTHQCENWDNSALGRVSDLPFPASAETPAVAMLRRRLSDAGDSEAVALLNDAYSQAWDAGRIAGEFARLGEWSKTHDCPVVIGEFGVLNFCVDPASRANWARAVREAAEANGIGWTWWELDQGFGFIRSRLDTDGFDHSMIDALTGEGG